VISFTNPSALLLFLLLPLVVVIGWPRLAYRRRRDTLSLIVRLALVLLLILGLAGIQVQHNADRLAVVFLLDVSDSISPAMQGTALEFVRASTEHMTEQDQAAVIVFGADALVETPMTGRLELAQLGSDPVRLNTDLAEAMRLGLALFPADTAKRMVILSDGKQTTGDAEEVARLAAATNVQVEYVPLIGDMPEAQIAGPEILVTDVQVPTTVSEGETFDLTVTIESNRRNSQAEVRVLSSGQIIHRQEVELQQGRNTFVFSDIIVPAAGFVDFRVVVEPRSADNFFQNNELSAFSEVTGPPRVLLVSSDEREIESLRTALEQTGLQVETQGPRDLPLGLAPLSSYDSIVLANIPATELSDERMAFLQAYVRDLGGGLVVIGGPASFGVGGYFDTPLEETLPVEMRLRDQERVPQLTMLFVLDRSGSMEVAGPSGVSNLELAKEAVIRSFNLLNDDDRVGVLSFDISAYYVLEIQDVGDEFNRERMRLQVGSLRPGGGTNIRQAVLSADTVLRDDPSQLRHIILLTDGGSDPSGIVSAVDRMYQNYGVTTSVVAIGAEYAPWLENVAAAGAGKFHLAFDVSTIPAIFTAETLLATRSYIMEEELYPLLVARHPITSGLDSVPALQGYVATTAKDTATVILRAPDEADPILATWQYGLGRAVAFTSDASSRWAANWIDWPGYADFWSQAVRWSITEGASSNLEVSVMQRGEQTVLVADARDNQGNYLNGLQLEASVINTQLDSVNLTLQQTAPGRYEAVFAPEREGSYFITVAGSPPEGTEGFVPQRLVQTTGWVLSYSAEYRVDVSGTAENEPVTLLRRIADVTGGGVLTDQPERVFLHNLDQEQAARPLWPYFVLAALLLLPFDVAVRRLVLTSREVNRVRDAVSRRAREPAYASPATSGRMNRLLDAKGRARSTAPTVSDEERPPAPPAQPARPTTARPAAPRVPPPPSAVQHQPPSEPNASLASRLLERRRAPDDQDKS